MIPGHCYTRQRRKRQWELATGGEGDGQKRALGRPARRVLSVRQRRLPYLRIFHLNPYFLFSQERIAIGPGRRRHLVKLDLYNERQEHIEGSTATQH